MYSTAKKSLPVNNAMGKWPADDGNLEIHNNLVENASRPLALVRKKYLFAGSHVQPKKQRLSNLSLPCAERQRHTLLSGSPKIVISKGKGKSGGARVITYVKVTATTVFLSAIYDKSEKSTISDKELQQIFRLLS